jgi:uncharacterized membrane protein YczE
MASDIEQEGIEHLEHIEQKLDELKERSGTSPWVALRNGVFQGAGAIVGSIAAVLLIGCLLSLFGIIPGFSVIGQEIQNAISQIRVR